MKKIVYILTVVLSVFISVVNAQKEEMIFPKMRIGFTTSALVNTHPAVQISFDRKISNLWNFSLESGFIFASEENAKGFRLRPGIETFVARSSWISLSMGMHLNYRYAIEYLNINNISREGEFVRWDYNVRNNESRIGLNLGENLVIKMNQRLYAEMGSGLGLMTIINRRPLPDFDVEQLLFNRNQENFTLLTPYLYLHINFSYSLVK